MPSIEDLIILLSGIHVNDRNRRRSVAVAGHLVAFALGKQWNKTSERQRDLLIRDSANRLWNGYMVCKANENLTPKEAARDAIFDEQTILDQLINPGSKKQGLSEQLDDFQDE